MLPLEQLTGDLNLPSTGTWMTTWTLPKKLNSSGPFDFRIKAIATESLSATADLREIDLGALLPTFTDLSSTLVLNNPYRGQTEGVLLVNLPENSKASVFNISGNILSTLKTSTSEGGTLVWDAKYSSGRNVAPGVYLCKVVKDSETKVVKIIVSQ